MNVATVFPAMCVFWWLNTPFATYLGQSLRSRRGSWNPGGPLRPVQPRRARPGKRGATEAIKAAFQRNIVVQSYKILQKRRRKYMCGNKTHCMSCQSPEYVRQSVFLLWVHTQARCDTFDALEKAGKLDRCAAQKYSKPFKMRQQFGDSSKHRVTVCTASGKWNSGSTTVR